MITGPSIGLGERTDYSCHPSRYETNRVLFILIVILTRGLFLHHIRSPFPLSVLLSDLLIFFNRAGLLLGALALNPFMSVQPLLAKESKRSSNMQHAPHFLRVSPREANASSRSVTTMTQFEHIIVSSYSAIENRELHNGLSDPQRGLHIWKSTQR